MLIDYCSSIVRKFEQINDASFGLATVTGNQNYPLISAFSLSGSCSPKSVKVK